MKFYTIDNQFIEETDIWPPNFTGIVENCGGTKEWFVNGKRHRLEGPAVEWANGSKYWFVNGKCHRLDGPAYEGADGPKVWFIEGKKHRIDGPACEWSDGLKGWWVDNKQVTEKQCNLLYSIMKLKDILNVIS